MLWRSGRADSRPDRKTMLAIGSSTSPVISGPTSHPTLIHYVAAHRSGPKVKIRQTTHELGLAIAQRFVTGPRCGRAAAASRRVVR